MEIASDNKSKLFVVMRFGDTQRTRALSRSIIHMLLLRGLFPGSVVDRVPVFFGDGGIGKSPLLKLMALGRPELFSDGETLTQDKTHDMLAVVGGAWVVELPEASGLWKKDAETLKTELGKTSDRTRRLRCGKWWSACCTRPMSCVGWQRSMRADCKGSGGWFWIRGYL